MADTLRKRIFNAIVVELSKGQYGLGSVLNEQPMARDIQMWLDPQCFIWPVSDDAASGEYSDSAIQLEWWVIHLAVVVYGSGDVEEYLGQIHKAMNADQTWGGIALDTTRTSSDTLDFDPSRSQSGIMMMFDIRMRHHDGDPYTLA